MRHFTWNVQYMYMYKNVQYTHTIYALQNIQYIYAYVLLLSILGMKHSLLRLLVQMVSGRFKDFQEQKFSGCHHGFVN